MDGTINGYEQRRIDNAHQHIGERVLSTSGMEMEVISWNTSNDIVVRFEDGAIRHCAYQSFKLGLVAPYPGRNSSSIRKAFERVGETNISKYNHMKMWVSRYTRGNDITVRFEDGIEVNSSYAAFKRGTVRHPADTPPVRHRKKTVTPAAHANETVMNADGMAVTLVKFESKSDVSVRFEDGTEINHVSYDAFISGTVRHPTAPAKMPTRMKMPAPVALENDVSIVEFSNDAAVTVEFQDGTRRQTGVNDIDVVAPSGKKRHPRSSGIHIGETVISESGMAMTVIAAKAPDDITVRFENGYIKEHCSYQVFQTGAISPPRRAIGNMVYSRNYKIFNGVKHWKCRCTVCGHEEYLTIAQMRLHNCHNLQNSTQETLKTLAESIGDGMDFG